MQTGDLSRGQSCWALFVSRYNSELPELGFTRALLGGGLGCGHHLLEEKGPKPCRGKGGPGRATWRSERSRVGPHPVP